MDSASDQSQPAPPPSADLARKRELRAFLMSRRARLKPADVGLRDTARRRTPGLRREDVAELAGLSTAWYTMFEMAKETRVSRKTLEAVATALKLSPSETRHLQVLAAAVSTAPPASVAAADPVIAAILAGFRTGPALLVDDRTDIVAMNEIAVALFGALADAVGFERNWLWYVVHHRGLIANWEEQVQDLAAMFRATYCEHATRPDYHALLDELLRCTEFARYWVEHNVNGGDQPPRPLILDHPVYGHMRFAFRVLDVQSSARARCYFYTPDATTLAGDVYRELRASLDERSGQRADETYR